jgi:hypothetical protein
MPKQQAATIANATNSEVENVPEIQALALRVEELTRSVDFWNQLMIWGLAVAATAAVFIVVATRVVVSRTGQLSTVQDLLREAKDRQLQVDLSQKGVEIGQLKVAADASEVEIAATKTEMAKQQTRAATAERSLLELQERIKPRRLTDKQSEDFVAILGKSPNTSIKLGWTSGGGDECFKFLQQLMPLFKQAHWKVPELTTEVSNHLDIQVTGIALLLPGPEGADVRKPEPATIVHLTPAQTTLQAAFKAVGIDLQFQRWFHTADGIPELVIGSKPDP